MSKIHNFTLLGRESRQFTFSNQTPKDRLLVEIRLSLVSFQKTVRGGSLFRYLFLLLGLLLVLSFNSVNAQDTDLDGVPDIVDLDDDNDGILDVVEQLSVVVVADDATKNIDVYTANGDGTFNATPLTSTTTGGVFAHGDNAANASDAFSTDMADVNGDGIADIVSTSEPQDMIRVHLGNSDGTFGGEIATSGITGRLGNGQATTSRATNLTDANLDGLVDVVVAESPGQNVSVYTSNGDGTFNTTPIVSSSLGGWFDEGDHAANAGDAYSTDMADVNGDGVTDIVVTGEPWDGIRVYLGNTNGTFNSEIFTGGITGRLGNGHATTSRATNLADANQDGLVDVVVAESPGQNVSVYTSNGDGTFNTTPIVSTSLGGWFDEGDVAASAGDAYSTDMADVNGDGIPDIVVTGEPWNAMSIYLGNGDGTFNSEIQTTGITGRLGNGYATSPAGTWRATNLSFLILDTDSDGIADHLDLDSDGDGIPDNIEAQTTAGFVVPGTAVDVQGRLIAYGVNGITPNDNDGDGTPDWRDLDTDNDGDNDADETGFTLAGTDADGDGLDDNIDDDDTQFGSTDNSTNAGITNVLTHYPNNGTEAAWRVRDRDLDGVEDQADLDDDNDGILDVAEMLTVVVVADDATKNIDVYTANGDGTFNATPITSTTTGGVFAEGDNAISAGDAYSTDMADVNGDGIADIISTSEPQDMIRAHLGNGDGTFGGEIATTGITGRLGNGQATIGGGLKRATNLADANMDGLVDVVVAESPGQNVSVYTSNGDGTFNTTPIVSTSLGGWFDEGDLAANATDAYSTDMADVNGDGVYDIVVTGEPWDGVRVYLGNSNGTFNSEIFTGGITGRLGNGHATTSRATNLADANRDGLADIVVAESPGQNVSVYTSNGDGTFNSTPIVSTSLGGWFDEGDVAAGATDAYSTDMTDVNGDGIPDIVVTGEPWDAMRIYLGNGDGTFNNEIQTTGITGRLGNGYATSPAGAWRATNLSFLTLDTDLDGIADHLDLDSDNDGIPDNIEAQTTAGYTTPTGTVNAQGVDLAYIGGLSPVDTENDTIPDYIDTDADNDGLTDLLESQLTVSGTVGYNGMDANVEATDDYSDVNGTIDTPLNLPDSDSDGEADFRDLPAPGGVNLGLTVWLKANSGFTSSVWRDYSGNNNHTTQGTPANQPGWASSFFNYNPTTTFDGNDDVLLHADELGGIFQGVNANTIFTMMKNGNMSQMYFSASGACAGQFGLMQSAGNTFDVTRCGVSSEVGQGITNGEITIRSATRGNNDTYDFYNNHGTPIVGATVQNFSAGTGNLQWGAGLGSPNFGGAQAEGIIYDRELTTLEMQRVHSYLAIKYGITLDQTTPTDYIASDGTTIIWDASVTPAYNNNIIGIGEDNSQGLYQKQSHTEDDTTNLFISTLMADNASNTGDVTNDLSYIVMGDNGGSMLGIQSEMPAGIYSRLGREWKVTNTNFINDFSVEWEVGTTSPINLADLRLLVDDDGDFSNATIINTPDVTFALGSVIVSGIGLAEIPANSTRYITLASVDAATPLPIALTVFTAEENGDHVDLKWETTSELNNDYFTVEKSQDGSEWREVLQVPGAGTTSEPRSYHDIDPDPYLGLSYYRLKQTDYSGEETYSNIAAVSFEGNLMTAFPNPVNAGEELQLRFLDIIEGDVQVTLRDILGKEYVVKTFKNENNTNDVIIKLGDTISSGVYQIVVSYRGMINVLRIVVE